MKNRFISSPLPLVCYFVPAAFLAMYGDAEFGTMWLYVLPLIGLPVLARFAGKAQCFPFLLLGNLLSLLSSLACVFLFQTGSWGGYFKPFTPFSMVLLITAGSLIIQLAVWGDARRSRKNR